MWYFGTGFFCVCFQGLSLLHISIYHLFLRLNSIPLLHRYSAFKPIHQLMEICLFLLFVVMNNGAMNKFCVDMFSFPLDVYLGVELLGHFVILHLTFWEISRLFSKATASFYVPTRCIWDFCSLHILIKPFYCLSFWL